MAAVHYLLYASKARILHLKDIYHREWNDVQGAIRASGLWYAILLTSVTFNLCFGPWEGAAWMEKVAGMAKEYCAKESCSGP
eukprot:10464124-Lingulodinium_polyedra.AAC.1